MKRNHYELISLGAVQVGVAIHNAASADICSASVLSMPVPETAKSTVFKMKRPRLPETKGTQNLSTAKLQRLVLLEQLEVLRLKKRKLMKELGQEELFVTEYNKVHTQLV